MVQPGKKSYCSCTCRLPAIVFLADLIETAWQQILLIPKPTLYMNWFSTIADMKLQHLQLVAAHCGRFLQTLRIHRPFCLPGLAAWQHSGLNTGAAHHLNKLRRR